MSPEVTRLCKCFLWALNARSQGFLAERHTVQKMTNIIWFTCQRFQCFGPNVWPSTCSDMPACICTVKATHKFATRVSLFFFPLLYMPRIYGDNRCYLAPVKHSSAFLKNESITNHIFFSSFKANKYSNFLKPLKSVAKYWEHKEVLEKWYEWQYGSTALVQTQAILSADRLTSFNL